MKLDVIKCTMRGWYDFYGQDINNKKAIQKARSKKKLKTILKEHRKWLEDQNNDAINHIDRFIKLLGLDKIE